LGGLFITSLVVSNLIFQKFFYWRPFDIEVFGSRPWSSFKGLLLSGFLFKVLVAALDTPLLYLGVYLFRKRFNLKVNEEISLL